MLKPKMSIPITDAPIAATSTAALAMSKRVSHIRMKFGCGCLRKLLDGRVKQLSGNHHGDAKYEQTPFNGADVQLSGSRQNETSDRNMN